MTRRVLLAFADIASLAVLCVAVPVSLIACIFAHAADWLADLADALEAWHP